MSTECWRCLEIISSGIDICPVCGAGAPGENFEEKQNDSSELAHNTNEAPFTVECLRCAQQIDSEQATCPYCETELPSEKSYKLAIKNMPASKVCPICSNDAPLVDARKRGKERLAYASGLFFFSLFFPINRILLFIITCLSIYGFYYLLKPAPFYHCKECTNKF